MKKRTTRSLIGLTAALLGVIVYRAGLRELRVLRAGDVITTVDDGVLIESCSAFFAYIMQDKPPGSTLRLKVLRDRDTFGVTLPVAE